MAVGYPRIGRVYVQLFFVDIPLGLNLELVKKEEQENSSLCCLLRNKFLYAASGKFKVIIHKSRGEQFLWNRI